MNYKPMPFPRLGNFGPCKFQGVVDIGGKPYAIWEAPEFDDRNKRVDTIHLIEFEPEEVEVSEFERHELEDSKWVEKPPRTVRVKK